ncbi:MAG TPA: zinc ribbon domain-containing protein [Ktedonobacteraceae bacterium]|nr:zinc ribbon domain-containing protein [Ktedonobacteraceae bacterium]
MSDFVESAKNIVSSAVSRTSWQAQKQLRVRAKQGEIDQLIEQRQHLLDELASIAMNLYQQGKLSDAQLSRLCASIQELDSDVQNHQAQLQEIKSEQYNPTQFAPSATANYTPPPVTPSPSPTAQQPYSQQPPTRQRPPQPQQPQQSPQLCPNCGSPVRPNALYCRNCGAKLR